MTDEPPHKPELQNPEYFPIPPEAIERWLAIPRDAEIVVHITRESFDNLYYSIQALTASHLHLGNALAAWTNNQLEAANAHFEASKLESVRSVNNLSMMMATVMARAQRYDG